MCGSRVAEQCWARSRSQLSPSSRLSDWIYIKVRFWPAAAIPALQFTANNPTHRDGRWLSSFEVNKGRRRREKLGQVFLYLWVCRASEQIWFGIQFDTEGGKLASTLLYILMPRLAVEQYFPRSLYILFRVPSSLNNTSQKIKEMFLSFIEV